MDFSLERPETPHPVLSKYDKKLRANSKSELPQKKKERDQDKDKDKDKDEDKYSPSTRNADIVREKETDEKTIKKLSVEVKDGDQDNLDLLRPGKPKRSPLTVTGCNCLGYDRLGCYRFPQSIDIAVKSVSIKTIA